MLKDIKRLTKETFIYGFSTIGGRLLNFLLLPIYTHALTPADYGVVATMFSYLAFSNVIYGYGMDFAFMRYAKPKEPGDPCFSTAFYSHLLTSVALSSFIYCFAAKLTVWGGMPANLSVITRYAALILAFDTLCLVPFADLRLSHKPKTYAGTKIFNVVLNLALNYIFLVRMGWGVPGVFLASAITSASTFLLVSPWLLRRLRLAFERKLLPHLLRFSLPLVPAGLAAMAVQVIDRPILQFLTNSATVGLYQANYRLGSVMMLCVSMFDAAWRPFFLEKAEAEKNKALFARVMTYFIVVASFLWLALTFFTGPIVSYPIYHGKALIHSTYWVGLPLVPIVALGYIFNGVYINLLAPVTLARKTDRVAYATAIGAAVNIVAIFAWTPRWGMIGTAWATLAAYVAMAAALYVMASKIYPIDYELGRVARVGGALAVIVIAAKALKVGVVAGSLWLKLGLMAAFPILLLASGFLSADEKAGLRRRAAT
ncbi:MAG TPA: oligosaccharide flippase family protein [Elusimicrobiota bacterium]|nr:oligosaccharide flippase family protein [Elusimicrobiota bacterium]